MSSLSAYLFGPFALDPTRRSLAEGGVAVALGGRAFDLLVVLVEGRDRILTKDELLRRVWPGHAVEENNLTVNISALRKALRDLPTEQRYIRTIPGRGYQFVAVLQPGRGRGDGSILPGTPTVSTLSEMPSLAVLPFVNLSDDPNQEHFVDGIAEDIIGALSRNRWLTVIARQSSFTFKGAALDIAEVARQLNVRYVLEGSVRKLGDRVRVATRLLDAAMGTHLVAERWDREVIDIFAVQDEITALITTAVRPALYEAEQTRSMRKRPESMDAWAAYQRGVWHFSRDEEPETAEAQVWFERALALDPRFAPGSYGLALVYLHDGSAFLPRAVPDWQARGEGLAQQAVTLDERDSGAHSVLGLARMVRGDHAGSLEATARALDLNPNDATAHGTRGATLVFCGRPLEGLEVLGTSLRLSPRDPRLKIRLAHIGLGHLFASQHAEAEDLALRIMRQFPAYSFGPRLLAIVMAETGRAAEAAGVLGRAIALSPAPFDRFSHARMPWYRPEEHRRVVAALRAAGWTGQVD